MHTPWMFPWERRQLRGAEDGKGLRTWEKLYWGVFVTAISVFLFSRLLLPNHKKEEDPVRSPPAPARAPPRTTLASPATIQHGSSSNAVLCIRS